MNRSEHLLTCLAEECAEVAQRVSKALRFGLAEVQPGQPLNNAERIMEELDDLFSVANILMEDAILHRANGLSGITIAAKRAKIEKFMAISREQGTLTAEEQTP
jgi:NTP pyrophosphatase (non-canonical NTP hydrolase)